MISRALLPAAILSLAMLGPASGQDAAPSARVLEEIMVTAQKRTQAAIDVPIGLSVIDRMTLESGRIRTLDDLEPVLPNFRFERAGFNSLAIRGMGGGGRNLGFDTRAGLYVDGVYAGQAQSLMLPLLDAAQVELLRGPQGYLFGRNTVAGAVTVTTVAPSAESEARVYGGYGNRDALEVRAILNGSIHELAAGRLAASFESRRGYTHNLTDGSRLDDLERLGTRARVALTPHSRVAVDLSADYSRTRENAILGEPQTDLFDTPLPGGALPARQVRFNTRPYSHGRLFGAGAHVSYELDRGATLTAVSGYRNVLQQRQNDTDYGPADLLRINYDDDFGQFSQEVRLASGSGESLQWMAGLYYLREAGRSDRRATIGEDTDVVVPLPATAPVAAAPFGAAFGLAPGTLVPLRANATTRDAAVFASADMDLTAQLTLNLGARYTHERKNIAFDLDGSQSGGFRIATLNDHRDKRSDSRLDVSAGLVFAVAGETNLYARAATGFKSGGWNVDFLSTAQAAAGFGFDTETVESFELGVKGRIREGRVRYDAALFQSRFEDFQVFQFVALPGGATVLQLRNAARVSSQGVDLSATWQATPALRLQGAIGHVRARFDRFPDGGPAGLDLSGSRLAGAPAYSGALTAVYGTPFPALAGHFDLYGEVGFRDRFYTAPSRDPAARTVGSRALVKARIAYAHERGRFGLGLWVRNLFDDKTPRRRARDFLGSQYVLREAPRGYGMEFWRSF